jgi:hypothetical protein
MNMTIMMLVLVPTGRLSSMRAGAKKADAASNADPQTWLLPTTRWSTLEVCCVSPIYLTTAEDLDEARSPAGVL